MADEATLVPVAAPPDPLTMLQLMIEKGVDPDALGKMMDLADRWKADRAREAFMSALNQCQAEMPVIVKDAVNRHANNSPYVYLETLQHAIRPIYTRHGFSVSWSQGEAPAGFTRIIGTLFHVGGHSKDYQGDYPIDGVGAKGGAVMNPLQGTVSSHTYAQRDMLRLMFNLTIAGQDLDGVPPADNRELSPDQIETINNLLTQAQHLGHIANLRRFWAFIGERIKRPVEGLADVPEREFGMICKELNRLIAKGERK